MMQVLIMIIRILISVGLGVYAYIYALRYNLHMFQLNGYKNGEHLGWLRRYRKRQWVLYVAVPFGVL